MPEISILFTPENGKYVEKVKLPDDTIKDLHIDELISEITSVKKEYQLEDYFFTPLRDLDTIHYRQEISKNIEKANVFEALKFFGNLMSKVHSMTKLINELYYEENKYGWLLEAVLTYCNVLYSLNNLLNSKEITASGLKLLGEYLSKYISSEAFQNMSSEAKRLKEEISNLTYILIIEPGKFTVKPFDDEREYTSVIEEIFGKFNDEECSEEYKFDIVKATGMTHIEAKITEFLKKLYPEPFEKLKNFYERYLNFIDETIVNFEREVQFYISYFEFISNLKSKGLKFCYPSFTKDILTVNDAFDIVLASKEKLTSRIVCNDIFLKPEEKMIIITGPNQGGKTTYARMFGLIHYIASLGLPVPASYAEVLLPSGIYTHFERREDVKSEKSKLEEELFRLRKIIEEIDEESIVILNEPFSSAALHDAIELSEKIIREIIEKNVTAVWVTFLDTLTKLDKKIVSMVALVSADDPTIRTFKVTRKDADGKAYAISLAEKYGLTYEKIKGRFSI